MSFYNPMMQGPDYFGGIGDLLNQLMMLKLIQQQYPGGQQGGNETLTQTQLPPGMNLGALLGMGGQPQIGQTPTPQTPQPMQALQGMQSPGGQTPLPQQGNIMQLLQMLGGLPGLSGIM